MGDRRPTGREGATGIVLGEHISEATLGRLRRLVYRVDGLRLTLLARSADGDVTEVRSLHDSVPPVHPLCARICRLHAGELRVGRVGERPEGGLLAGECGRALRSAAGDWVNGTGESRGRTELTCQAGVRHVVVPVRFGETVVGVVIAGPFLPEGGPAGLAVALEAVAAHHPDMDPAGLREAARSVPALGASAHLQTIEDAVALIAELAETAWHEARLRSIDAGLDEIRRAECEVAAESAEATDTRVLEASISAVARTAGLRAVLCLLDDPLRGSLRLVASSGRAPRHGLHFESELSSQWASLDVKRLCPVSSDDEGWGWLFGRLQGVMSIHGNEHVYVLPLTAGERPHGLLVFVPPWRRWPSRDWQDRDHCLSFLRQAGELLARWTGVLHAEEQARAIESHASHGLRSELQSAVCAVELLQRLGMGDERRSRKLMGDVRHTLQHIQSRTDAARWLLDPRPGGGARGSRKADLAAIVRETARDLGRQGEQRSVEISTHVDPRVNMRVEPDLLRVALGNIIENAVKYSQPGRRVDVDVVQEPAGVVLRVSNFGPGISEAEWTRVFERGYRGAQATATNTQGLGIGLALADRAVKSLGGSASVRSQPIAGRGTDGPCLTTFELRLPRGTDE